MVLISVSFFLHYCSITLFYWHLSAFSSQSLFFIFHNGMSYLSLYYLKLDCCIIFIEKYCFLRKRLYFCVHNSLISC